MLLRASVRSPSLMKTSVAAALLVLPFVVFHPTARAEVAVTMDHNEGPAATDEFRFKTVPPPRQSAAIGATFTILDGAKDSFSSSPDALHDGKVPDSADQPESAFFFQNGSDGGRLLVDLGKVIPIREVDTYSWHPDVRGPQVYKVYGSDGSGGGFVEKPTRPLDPAQAGWKLLASVDTRQKFGGAGGQYGVSIVDPGGTLGRYRYLLFDVMRTEAADPFGNTFYSEIAVIDRDAPASPALARPPKESFTYDQKGIHLIFTNDSPSFDPKERERLVQTFFTVYPKMAAEFNPNAPKAATISIETKYHGVAATAGGTIHVNPDWFRRNPEDLDVMTHEGMHVVQQYRQWDPGWLTEGIADYARYKFGVNNPAAHWTMPDYQPNQSYKDAYRVTARFLAWLEKHVKPGIVVTLDHAMRNATYTPDIWKQQTGKTVDELWQDYGKNPAL